MRCQQKTRERVFVIRKQVGVTGWGGEGLRDRGVKS